MHFARIDKNKFLLYIKIILNQIKGGFGYEKK